MFVYDCGMAKKIFRAKEEVFERAEARPNLEDMVLSRDPSRYLSAFHGQQMEDRRTVVEKIVAHLPEKEEVLRMLDRIEKGIDEPGEVESWLLKKKKKELIFMAIGDDAQRAKLMTLPVQSIMAESTGEDADALPSDVAVERLKQRAAELAKVIKGVSGIVGGGEEPVYEEGEDGDGQDDGSGPGF